MTLLVRLCHGSLAIVLCAGLTGCVDSSRSQVEEEKESHYLDGKSCLNSMDYRGAIKEFEKALKLNPESASAHFQLGCLYEEKEPDPAAAIYHYQQFLKLRPNSDNAEWIQQRIANCKQDLAKSVLLPMTPGVQHQLEQLAEEKKRLQEELDRWKSAYVGVRPAQSNLPNPTPPRNQSQASVSLAANSASHEASGDRSARTHTVQSGEAP